MGKKLGKNWEYTHELFLYSEKKNDCWGQIWIKIICNISLFHFTFINFKIWYSYLMKGEEIFKGFGPSGHSLIKIECLKWLEITVSLFGILNLISFSISKKIPLTQNLSQTI